MVAWVRGLNHLSAKKAMGHYLSAGSNPAATANYMKGIAQLVEQRIERALSKGFQQFFSFACGAVCVGSSPTSFPKCIRRQEA